MSLHRRPRADLPAETGEGARSAPGEDLELPRPWRLILTAGWNLAESLGLPAAGYLTGAALGGQAAGLAVAMAIASAEVVELLTTAVTIGGVVAGALLSALWFVRVLRRLGLHVRFIQA